MAVNNQQSNVNRYCVIKQGFSNMSQSVIDLLLDLAVLCESWLVDKLD